MRLRTPVTGTVIEVADEKAQAFMDKGFQKVCDPVKPVKVPPKKASARKPKSKE